ncbi:MAG: cysteine desulfurase [candidate division KSB1 bacterium]|nr:cysteine desulfurase [candidate division KSB1 bacterium]MDZ7304980.1 cysteine desulfurase [candidate division KSB1 bacterium]MDZ7314023.1 cysteine desulfurase [candidate division KSB1 bacterium]
MLDAHKIRQDFPILQQKINGKPLVYLDNAATSQKPLAVLRCLDEYYRTYNANIRRGIHTLSEKATARYEETRRKVAQFINAPSANGVIFTRNTTESLNLVAYSYARKFLKAGDEILLTEMEHHSNLVPWQILAQHTGVKLKFIPVTEQGTLDLADIHSLLTEKTKILAFTHMSNVLGTINPVRRLAQMAHEVGAVVVVDGAQGAPHLPVDVQQLDCDFYAFSGHKMLGPTGVGVLWGKVELLDKMDPFLGGGEMIHEVWLDRATYEEVPHKFEAGTPNIAQVIGLGAAIDYLRDLTMPAVAEHERRLTRIAIEKLQQIDNLRIIGSAPERGAAISFLLPDVHAHDLSTVVDSEGVAIRAGHHCAQPLMRKFDVPATARASLYIYNLPEEIDILVNAIRKARKLFGHVS